MTEPTPGAPIPASSTEGYTIRIPKLSPLALLKTSAGAAARNSPHLLTLAVIAAAFWIIGMRLRGQPIDLSTFSRVVDFLMTNDNFVLIGTIIATQFSALLSRVKAVERRLLGHIDTLRGLIAEAQPAAPDAVPAAPQDDKRARLKALLAEAEHLQSEIELTKGDLPT